jgi:hypothetical protein
LKNVTKDWTAGNKNFNEEEISVSVQGTNELWNLGCNEDV